VLALSAPAALGLDRADALVRGLLREADKHACPLVGGNLARARETSLTLTVFGAVASGRALRRNAARVGDRLFVTGTLGRSALELARARHFGGRIRTAPEGRLAAGRALARLPWRGACIDLSDGLGADLPHLLEAGGLGAEVEAARLPRPRGFDRACARLGLDPLRLLVGGGEDYELLFTLRPRAPAPAVLSRRLGVPVSEIGRIVRRPGIHGLPGALVRQGGWRHF
jgi:thiamine-monophosphate kinase